MHKLCDTQIKVYPIRDNDKEAMVEQHALNQTLNKYKYKAFLKRIPFIRYLIVFWDFYKFQVITALILLILRCLNIIKNSLLKDEEVFWIATLSFFRLLLI